MTFQNSLSFIKDSNKKITHRVSFSFCNSSTCCLKTAMTSLEAAASSCTACKSSFIFISSRSVTASLEDLPRKLEPLTDPWAANGGVGDPDTNPAELLDFLSLRDLRILLKAYIGKNEIYKISFSYSNIKGTPKSRFNERDPSDHSCDLLNWIEFTKLNSLR